MEREKLNLEESVGSTIKRGTAATLETAEKVTTGAGEALGSAAESLRQHLPGGAKVGEAVDTLSRGAKHTADYLREEGLSGIVEDLEVLIRRYPLQTLLLGVGCGYVLSRLRPD